MQSNVYAPVADFELTLEDKGSYILFGKAQKTIKIEWHGNVDLDTAKKILTKGASFIEEGSANKILLNRKDLIEFNAGVRQWIKDDLLKKRGKLLVSKVEKVATVKSSTNLGNLFANIVSTTIKIVFPKLRMSSFETEEEALDWLLQKS